MLEFLKTLLMRLKYMYPRERQEWAVMWKEKDRLEDKGGHLVKQFGENATDHHKSPG
jgi:hypothetical protein